MKNGKLIASLCVAGWFLCLPAAWAQYPSVKSVVFSPSQKTLWLETQDGPDSAIIYLSAAEKTAKLVQGKMTTLADSLNAEAIFAAGETAQQVLIETQNTLPIAEQQALWDSTCKLIAGEYGFHILRAAKFAAAAQTEPSVTLAAAIKNGPNVAEGGNGGNPKQPIGSVAEGGNGGNPKRPVVSITRVAEGGNGGNPKHPVSSVAEGGNGGNPKHPLTLFKELLLRRGGAVKSLPSGNF